MRNATQSGPFSSHSGALPASTPNRAHFAPALVHLLVDGLYKGMVVVLEGVMAASQVGINVGAALAGIGVVGIAAGFAA